MSNSRTEAKSTKLRSVSGSSLVLLALGVLLAVFAIGVLGLDIAHNTTSRTSLQDATDAAALAGASAIAQNAINPSNGFGNSNASWPSPYLQYNDTTIGNAVQDAVYARAAQNLSDGHYVSQSGGTTLSSPGSAINFYAKNPFGNQDVPENNGQCMVSGSETINNLFAGLLGHPTDVVTTQSTASAYTTVTGVNANTIFPIAVSLDTIVGHSGVNGNYPLNSPKSVVSNPNALDVKSQVSFTMEDPCANASWTTLNTLAVAGGPLVSGKDGAEYSANAAKYINKALLPSVLGTAYSSFNPLMPDQSGPPAQFVGESSSTGGAAYSLNSGIDLWGALSGAGSVLAKQMEGKTVILPVVGGDQPFWNQDANNAGTSYVPGARQTRPLVGFCSVKVTKVVWDSSNNCLMGFKGYLVKTLVKGTPGIVDPLVDSGSANNAANMAALANLSPGMVQLGNTGFNVSPTKVGNGTQVALNSWYQGHVPPGNNTIQEATLDPSNETIKPIASSFSTKMSDDMKNLCGGATYNETINWLGYQTPPFSASGVGMLKYNVNGDGTLPTIYDTFDPSTSLPFSQLLLNPLSQNITITGTYSDEPTYGTDIGLNHQGSTGQGYDIKGSNWQYAGPDTKTGPRYIVLDQNYNVMQQNGYNSQFSDPSTWPPLNVGADTHAGQGHEFQISLVLNPTSLNNGTGEYMVVLHAFDTDLGHGGMAGSYPGAPGTPPGGVGGAPIWYGDPAFYYLDIQFPQCPTF